MQKINKLQGYSMQQREICPFFGNDFQWTRAPKDSESLGCTLKANTVTSINCTSFKKKTVDGQLQTVKNNHQEKISKIKMGNFFKQKI